MLTEHVQEVLSIAEPLVGHAHIAAAGPVVRQGRNGRHLACAHRDVHREI